MNHTQSKENFSAAKLDTVQRYRRAVNYLAAAQIYLKGHPLLEEPLRSEHIIRREGIDPPEIAEWRWNDG